MGSSGSASLAGGGSGGTGGHDEDADLENDWPDPPAAKGSEAVAYQIDSLHDGSQPGDKLSLPLKRRWVHTFQSPEISYPLVAGGRIFVTVGSLKAYGSDLYALDEETGSIAWGPTSLGGTHYWSGATYSLGRVFTINYDGQMQAFDAQSGMLLWTQQLPGQYSFSSPPTAFGRRIFVGGAGSGGTVYAVAGNSGRVLWTGQVENGDNSSPAVSDSGVIVSYACTQAYSFAPTTGSLLWHYSGSCEGGGGRTVARFGSVLYARDWAEGNLILDATSGKLLGTFSASPIPAGAKSKVFIVNAGKLIATNSAQPAVLWTATGVEATNAPLVVGDQVVVGGSRGELVVFSAESGQELSRDMLDAPAPAPDEMNVVGPLTGMAAANNHLYVPAGSTLYAY